MTSQLQTLLARLFQTEPQSDAAEAIMVEAEELGLLEAVLDVHTPPPRAMLADWAVTEADIARWFPNANQ